MITNHKLDHERILKAIVKHSKRFPSVESLQEYLLKRKQRYLPVYFEGLNPDGTTNTDEVNLFNDLGIILDMGEKLKDDIKISGVWRVTTEPGWTYRYKIINVLGFALINWGYYEAWKVGAHITQSSNQNPALIQTGGEVEVIRNVSPRGNRTTGVRHRGYFGINTHTVANRDSDTVLEPNEYRTTVDGWSAGCTVFQNAEEFYNEFMSIVMRNDAEIIGQVYLPGDDY